MVESAPAEVLARQDLQPAACQYAKSQGMRASAPTGTPAAMRGATMETTAYIALSRQMALRRQMDLIANNIANVTASASKRRR
jgi:Flagella basal body rod protein